MCSSDLIKSIELIDNDKKAGGLILQAQPTKLPETLDPGKALAPVIVRFPAGVELPFGELGRLRVIDDQSRELDFAINGEAQLAAVGLDPDGISLGAVCIGATETAPLAVFASAAGGYTITGLTAPEAPFTFAPVAPVTLPGIVEGDHGNDVPFEVSVTPAVPGPLTAIARLSVDIRSAPTREIALTAEGIEAGVTAFPGALDFGTVEGIAPGHTVQLTNCTGAPLAVLSAAITGPNADEFGIAQPSDPAITLDNKARQDFVIVMAPRTPGPKIAQLIIQHAAGAQTVELVGNGAGEVPAPPSRDTYYRCSAGGGATGAWPLALALGLLARRRRRR